MWYAAIARSLLPQFHPVLLGTAGGIFAMYSLLCKRLEIGQYSKSDSHEGDGKQACVAQATEQRYALLT